MIGMENQELGIERRIFLLRGRRVMLSPHLALLYAVEPRSLIQAVKRNAARFPEDFMFQLEPVEYSNLKSQFGISSWGGVRTCPYAFTQEGIAMLSGVLNSERAIQANIEIMRAFVRLRGMSLGHKRLNRRLNELETRYDGQFKVVFDAIRRLIHHPCPPAKKIGFRVKATS